MEAEGTTAASGRRDQAGLAARKRRVGAVRGAVPAQNAPKSDRRRARRRSARGDLRLDNEPEPWHNSRDRLGLSELGAVTRVRWANRALKHL